MKFIPDDKENRIEVPYLDDARADDGWQGHSTKESTNALRAQISAEIGRLGGTVTRWQRGEYEIEGQSRPGIQIGYSIASPNGGVFEGRIDVAGLPWQPPYGGRKSDSRYKDAVERKKDQSLSMALYNVREALRAMRILQILSPGYSALVPWMLVADTGKTIGEMWDTGSRALPAPGEAGEIVDAQFRIVEGEA